MTLTERHPPAHVPTRTVAVRVVEGPDAGLQSEGVEVTIGTAEGNTLRLTDPAVSRFHAQLAPCAGGISVLDHGSTNGTFARSIKLDRGAVPLGTELRMGGTLVKLGEAQPIELEIHGAMNLGGLVGRSAVMRRLMAQIAKAASSEVSVLVTGESGTGKELVARALHDLGPRSGRPFVTIECGALPPTLLASELFGHERGAFTGADRVQIGAFEAAAGGTVFLDEIGELQPAVQATLLGALERRRVRRLGSRSEQAIDVRVVAATHRDLRAEVNAGSFRLDLYYRLAVVTLLVPPLRERRDDIAPLVEHFLRDCGWTEPTEQLISPQAMDVLARSHFAGNVRELRNLIEGAVAMGEPPSPGAAVVPGGPGTTFQLALSASYKTARAAVLDEFSQRYLDALLRETGGNVSEAARRARMTRSHLTELLTKYRKPPG